MTSLLSKRLAKLEVATVPRNRWFIVDKYSDDENATAQLAYLSAQHGELTDADTIIFAQHFVPRDPGRPIELDVRRAPEWERRR